MGSPERSKAREKHKGAWNLNKLEGGKVLLARWEFELNLEEFIQIFKVKEKGKVIITRKDDK